MRRAITGHLLGWAERADGVDLAVSARVPTDAPPRVLMPPRRRALCEPLWMEQVGRAADGTVAVAGIAAARRAGHAEAVAACQLYALRDTILEAHWATLILRSCHHSLLGGRRWIGWLHRRVG